MRKLNRPAKGEFPPLRPPPIIPYAFSFEPPVNDQLMHIIIICNDILIKKLPSFQGFAIGSAALVSLALFGAFVSRASIQTVDVLTPKVFIGLIVGAMLPYWFSAMTMKSVGSAALKMVEEVRRQFNTIPGLLEGTAKPDYATCVKISTDASIKEMIPPGALVMLTPLIVGTFFGVETLSGVLAGSLVSGVQVTVFPDCVAFW